MPDLPAADDIRIDLKKSADVEYWTQKLGVSREELAKVIESTGDRALEVARYLTEHGPPATSE